MLSTAVLVQLLMTGEPSLVAGTSELLESALRYNSDVLPRMYLTGAFFMALAYCGSNLLDIAQLFRASPMPPIATAPLTSDPELVPLSLTHTFDKCLPAQDRRLRVALACHSRLLTGQTAFAA